MILIVVQCSLQKVFREPFVQVRRRGEETVGVHGPTAVQAARKAKNISCVSA